MRKPLHADAIDVVEKIALKRALLQHVQRKQCGHTECGEGEKQYVVRDNGKPGPEVDVAKGYPTYEQLSALAEKPEPRSNALMYAIGAIALAAALGVVFVLRRRRKR